MKKTIAILAGTFIAVGAFAGPLKFTDATIQATGAVQTVQYPDTTDLAVSGWLDAVIIDITAGQTVTNTITLKTVGGGNTGGERTLLTLTNVTGDGVYPVRDLVTTQAGADISNEPARIALQGDKLKLTAQMTGADTNSAVTMSVYVILSPTP